MYQRARVWAKAVKAPVWTVAAVVLLVVGCGDDFDTERRLASEISFRVETIEIGEPLDGRVGVVLYVELDSAVPPSIEDLLEAPLDRQELAIPPRASYDGLGLLRGGYRGEVCDIGALRSPREGVVAIDITCDRDGR